MRPRLLGGALRGSSHAEYLLMLGAALFLAIIAISLLMYAPGTSGDRAKAASDIYWRGDAKPVQIEEASLTGDSQFEFVIQNAEADPLTITGVYIDGRWVSLNGSAYLGAGERRRIGLLGENGSFNCNEGQTGQMDVDFSYQTQYGTVRMQKGGQKLAIVCNLNSGSGGAGSGPGGEGNGNETCGSGSFVVEYPGEYYFAMDSFSSPLMEMHLSMISPRSQYLGTYIGDNPPLPPPASLGAMSRCDSIVLAWYTGNIGFWGFWGPFYAESECAVSQLAGNQWAADCDDGLHIGGSPDFRFEIYQV